MAQMLVGILLVTAGCTRFGFEQRAEGTVGTDLGAPEEAGADTLGTDSPLADAEAMEATVQDMQPESAVSRDATQDANAADASVATCEEVCPGTCVNGRCNITDPQTAVTCPDGVYCSVNCSGDSSCGETINCGTGPCTVTCSGSGSCSGAIACGPSIDCAISCAQETCYGRITCGPGPCLIDCAAGEQTCALVDCTSSCACDLRCPVNVCDPLSCPPGCDAIDGCHLSGGCDTCAQ